MFNKFHLFKNIGRGSQSQPSKPNNQITSQKFAIPSLQSSFRKQQSSTGDETSTSTSTTTTTNSQIADKSDSDSDDGQMSRPSFSMNPPNTNQSNEIIDRNPPNAFQPKPATRQLQRIPDTGFIVYETLPQHGQQQLSNNIIQVSAAKQGATVKSDVEVCKNEPNTLECVIRINDTVYGSAPITNGKKEAKTQAFDNALQYARKIHYTIKVIERSKEIKKLFANLVQLNV